MPAGYRKFSGFYSTVALVLPISTVVSGLWSGIGPNVMLTPRVQLCVNKLGITLSIICDNSRDSGISALNTVYNVIVHYHSVIR